MKLNHTICQLTVSSASPIRERWREGIADLSPMVVGGVALLCLLLAVLSKPLLAAVSERADVWAQYLTLGTLFPVVVAVAILMERSGRRLPTSLESFLIVLPIVAAAIAAGPAHSAIAIGLSLVQTTVCVLISLRQGGGMAATRLASLFAMGFVAWTVVLEMLTWPVLAVVIPPSLRLFIVGGLALVASCWWAFAKPAATPSASFRAGSAVDAAFLVALVLVAFRTDGLFTTDRLGEDGTFYHWGVLVGPAEAVRQGGWLLWDVPSPYGFLATLSLAALPTSSAWQSLYLLNAIASALLAVFLFFVLRAVRRGVGGSVFAFVIAASVVFLLSSWPPDLTPEHYFPNGGAFRYGWCYVLVGLLLLERRLEPGGRAQRIALLAGSACWLLSVLWSIESAFYGSAIWITAFVVIVLCNHGGFVGKCNWKAVASWLLLLPGLLAGALVSIALIYRVFLGRAPDAEAYIEAVLSFTGSRAGDLSGLFDRTGPDRTIAVILFGFLLLAMTAAAVARTDSAPRDLPIALGLAFGLWALASYPVGLPVPYAINRIMPFLVLALGIVLALLAPRYREQLNQSWVALIKAGTIPLLAGLLATAFTNVSALQYYADAIRREGFHGRDVTVGLPLVDSTLADLLQGANVKATDPILYAGAPFGVMMPVWRPAGGTSTVMVSRQWLAAPLSTTVFLPDDRKQTYMQRRADRTSEGGWLIERLVNASVAEQTYGVDSWFFAQLNASHIATKIAVNDDWQLVWYEPKGRSPAASLRGSLSDQGPALSPDLLINGQSLVGTVLPPIWGYFGPEWTVPTKDKDVRCAVGSGTLALFTPTPLQARIAMVFPRGEVVGSVQVTVNDGAAIDAGGETRSDKVQARVSLAAGWNTVVITRVDPSQSEASSGADDACGIAGSTGSALRIRTVDIGFRELMARALRDDLSG